MKSISLFLLGVIFYFFCSAQDYQIVRNDGTYYFEPDYNTAVYGCVGGRNFQCIRIDSVAIVDSNTIFFNLKEIHNEYYTPPYGNHSVDDMDTGCFQPRISWIGEKFDIRPGGINLFFNHFNDTIFVHTNTSQGEEWLFYRYPDGRYIMATDSLHYQMTFVGITDSVKYISLQEFDASNNPINSGVNQLSLILSKHHGIIRTLNFRDFPGFNNGYYLMMWNIVGLPGNQDGAHPLTYGEIFDFNVGDEFHYWKSLYPIPMRKIVTGKTFSDNNDTVTYQINLSTWVNTNNGFIDYVANITESYTNLNSYVMPENIAPSEAYNDLNYYSMPVIMNYFMINYCGGITAILTPGEEFLPDSPCFWYFYPFEPACIYSIYVKGCGKLSYAYFNNGAGISCNNCYDLVYIKKGSFNCGDPIGFYDIDEDDWKRNTINLSPNPCDGQFSIIGSNLQSPVSIRIFDMAGKMLYQKNQKSDELVDFSGHSPGIYFVQVISGNQVYTSKLIIVE